jgi:hypothetical protein
VDHAVKKLKAVRRFTTPQLTLAERWVAQQRETLGPKAQRFAELPYGQRVHGPSTWIGNGRLRVSILPSGN